MMTWVVMLTFTSDHPRSSETDDDDDNRPMPPRDAVLSPLHDRSSIAIDEVCPVCLCSLRDVDDVVRIRACGHLYCGTCISRWIYEYRSSKCALCMGDVRDIGGCSDTVGGVKRGRSDEDDEDGYSSWRPIRFGIRRRLEESRSDYVSRDANDDRTSGTG
jgi:hypothetical protein